MRHLITLLLLTAIGRACLGWAPPRPLPRASTRRFSAAAAPAAAKEKVVVFTDMDETLIAKKSTGFVIKFLMAKRAWPRLLMLPCLVAVLIPLSKLSLKRRRVLGRDFGLDGRTAAVRAMYWFAFRGMRVDVATRVAASALPALYVRELQEPAASAVLGADAAVVITASPEFMATPWLSRFLGIAPAAVDGAKLEMTRPSNPAAKARFTGRTLRLPMGDVKADLFNARTRAGAEDPAVLRDAKTVGYGDHPTDVPFLELCDEAVLVEPIRERPESIKYVPAAPFANWDQLAEQPAPR